VRFSQGGAPKTKLFSPVVWDLQVPGPSRPLCSGPLIFTQSS
jgi:hypothetical protein